MRIHLRSIVVAVGLFGCQSTPALEEVRYESTELVRVEDTELPSDVRQGLAVRGKHELLQVRLTSEGDLAGLAYESSLPIKAFSYFCDDRAEPVLLGYRYVYSGGHNLTSSASTERVQAVVNPEGGFEYAVYLHLFWLEDEVVPTSDRDQEGQKYRKFDLRVAAKDVCIEISLQGYLSGYRSNVVVVPDQDISAAIE